MSKHTPKPWKVFHKGNTIAVLQSGNVKRPIVEWNGFDSSPFPHGEKLANAYLIAASPKMLEALEELLECNMPQTETAWIADKRARVIIAKAKGNQ